MSHIAATISFGARVVDIALDLDVQPAPTATITVVSPQEPIYDGDTVVLRVDTTPAGGTVDSLTVDGTALTAAEDGTFSFTAAVAAPPAG